MGEWQRGWRIVLGASLGAGLGIPLFYYAFSLFSIDLMKEFGLTRGEMSGVQALIVVGALVAPVIGRVLDRYGFLRVYLVCTLIIGLAHMLMATAVTSLMGFALVVFIYGAAGVGCGPLAYTRPINAWFWHKRGLALGLAALGLAITAAIAPPLLAAQIEDHGWRSGFVTLAILSVLVGLPLVLALVRETPPEGPAGPSGDGQSDALTDKDHFRDGSFWLMVGAMLCMAIPGAGLLSQLSPMVQEEGIGPRLAAYGVTGYAIGQVVGRIVAGYFLDRSNPRTVAFIFTFLPAFGFVLLALLDLPIWAAVIAVSMIGVQQGAEIDLFAWFTARRFGLARYGTVYGWIIAAGWLGNAAGIVSFGTLHDLTGSYAIVEAFAAGLLMLGAILIAMVKVDRVK